MMPLDHIRVVDLSRVLSGPYCTMMLADMGAEVLKIERPEEGDDTRAFGPPFQNGESAYFISINRNKKSIVLDLKSPRAIELVRSMIAKADVVVENFRPGAAHKLGLGYEDVRELNERIVYASISGYGQAGRPEFFGKPGYDLVIQGISGLTSLTGAPDGPPYKYGTSIADLMAGICAFQGILLALLAREKSGRGQYIDVSMLDAQVSLLTFQAQRYFMCPDKVPGRMGNQHPTIAPYETFETVDGYLNLAVGNDSLWEKYCKVIGQPELIGHELFRTNGDRVRNRAELLRILGPIMRQRTTEDWVKILEKAAIACGPINTLDKALNHPQLQARQMVTELEHPMVGLMKTLGIPMKLSDTPGAVRTAAPTLGQHTVEVLRDFLGLSSAEIETLKGTGVIG
jgi:crotonobetainyl-CoA:carnitine CoA-transferase CaiB-like acyl-CoA transferase